MDTMVALITAGLALLASPNPAPVAGAVRRSDSSMTDSSRSVLVQNNRRVPVTVALEYGTFDRTLGTVPAAGTARFALSPSAAEGGASVRLVVQPMKGPDMETGSFSIRPHVQISLLVPEVGELPPTPADTMMQFVPASEQSDATITVDNPRDVPVTVFADHGVFADRLGEVPAMSRVTLDVPRLLVRQDQSIEILVHPTGGFDLVSTDLLLHRGDHLGLRVPTR